MNNTILEYTNELIEQQEFIEEQELFLEELQYNNLINDFNLFLENVTLEDMQELCPNYDMTNLIEEGVIDKWRKMPGPIKKILAVLGAGSAGSVAGMAMNPGGAIGGAPLTGGLVAKYGALAGGLVTLLGYASIKCMRHLWNFIRCSFRAFTFHKNAAGITTKGPGGSTIHTWDKR